MGRKSLEIETGILAETGRESERRRVEIHIEMALFSWHF
jgi:hypothetical protein